MHIHGMQNNLLAELGALQAAQQAATRKRAEETRRKLSEFASLLEGEADECVLASSGLPEDTSEREERKGRQDENPHSDSEADSKGAQVSDWA